MAKKPTIANLKNTEGFDRFDDVFNEYQGGLITEMYAVAGHEAAFLFKTAAKMQLKLTFLRADIVQFSYTFRHDFAKEPLYALSDNGRICLNKKADNFKLDLATDSDSYFFETPKIKVQIKKNDLKIAIFDKKNAQIIADTEGPYFRETIMQGTTDVRCRQAAPEGTAYFGLGDKSTTLNLRGKRFENWCTDAYAYGEKTDPLYRSIPFFYGLTTENIAYGLFFDNSYKTFFDFDSKKNNELEFSAEGGDLTYYFIVGPELLTVTRAYAWLTGVPEMPPMWALGFHQCRWSYFPESRVKEVAQTFRDLEIPCDAIYLDIDYMDNYKCFTWNKKHFPNPSALIADLKTLGFQTVVMIDPGIKVEDGYAVFTEGVEKNYFLTRPDGDLMIGQVWPGDSVYPDFTDPEVRDWFGSLYEKLYNEDGVSGFWNDMNEPANFKVWNKSIPTDVRHNYENLGASHKKAHNIYGMQMTRSTTEGLRTLQPDKRPFLLTRASYSGGQRYAAVWTGDNIASWEHLAIANRQMQRLNISGFVFSGSDIGGFAEKSTGELMVRWLQLGAFHPFYRVHTAGNNAAGDALEDWETVAKAAAIDRLDQEPWSFGDAYTPLAKTAIELRYRLLPYLYSAFWRHTQDGTPILQPMSFAFQNNFNDKENIGGVENEFMFGQHLLISPVVKKGQKKRTLYLPEGIWFDYETGEQYVGNQLVTIKTPLSKIPIFVAEGAVIPHYPVQQFVGEKRITTLELKVFYSNNYVETEFYEDEGEGFGYKNKAFSVTQFGLKRLEEELILSRFIDRLTYDSSPDWATKTDFDVRFYGVPFVVSSVLIDGQNVDFQLVDGIYCVKAGYNFNEISLMVT
jgi:alpha-glucosidase